MIYVSRYIGRAQAEEKLLPEIKELLEDEEGEVVTEALVQYQKHIASVFSDSFVNSNEAVDILCKFCEQPQKSDLCGIDLAIVLKKIGKIMVTLNRPRDLKLAKRIEELLVYSMNSN